MAQTAVANRHISIRAICSEFHVSETCYRYQLKLSDWNTEITDWLVQLSYEESNWGLGLCFDYLRNVKRFGWSHKRVYRIYCALALNLRIKPRRRLKRNKPEPIQCDNGPKFTSQEFVRWAQSQRIRIKYIQPGNPLQNVHIERHNRIIRYSWVSKHLFDSLEQLQNYATNWLKHLK